MNLADFNPPIGSAETLAPNLRRVLAPNPSPMTYRGTNTYLLGAEQIAVIDPGPESQAHLDALLSACSDQEITHIVVTHSHVDHSPLAKALSQATGAPVLAYGPSSAGRSDAMLACLEAGMNSGGEGIDPDFAPDILLKDGEVFSAGDQTLTALHTPGHMGNHLCFAWDNTLFCGDLVMGWASSLVSPPDGDLTDFMASCVKIRDLDPQVMHAGHRTNCEDRLAHRASQRSRGTDSRATQTRPQAGAHPCARDIYRHTKSTDPSRHPKRLCASH